MSFEIKPQTANTGEIEIALQEVTSHEREANVVDSIKASLESLLEILGNEYLSVTASGKINPVAGESGDEIVINIQSLAPPIAAPVEAPVSGLETPVVTPPAEVAPQPTPAPAETAPENPTISENVPPAPTPPVAPANTLENPVVTPEASG